jgi:hypothetical protein
MSYWDDHKAKVASKDRAKGASRRLICREIILAAKAAPCMDCGQRFPSICMDFDHVRGEKWYNLARMSSKGLGPDSIKAEIAKCELVCANCHRIRTENRRLGLTPRS